MRFLGGRQQGRGCDEVVELSERSALALVAIDEHLEIGGVDHAIIVVVTQFPAVAVVEEALEEEVEVVTEVDLAVQ